MLSSSTTFAYGAVGAVLALAVVQVLPYAFALIRGAELTLSPGRVVGALLVLLIFIAGGGIAAIIAGDASQAKQAIAYGLGWQATVGGFINGAVAANKLSG